MRAIAFKGNKDGFDWTVIEGTARATASIVTRQKSQAPADGREAQLAWVAKEVKELLHTHTPDSAAILKIGGGTFKDVIVARIEVDGVIRGTLGSARLPSRAIKSITFPTQFGVTKVELPELLASFPCMEGLPKTHHELLTVALAQLPA